MNRGNVSVVAAAQIFSSFLLTCEGMAWLSRPNETVFKFPDHRNCAVTQESATGFEPGTARLRNQRATTTPPRHTKTISKLQKGAALTMLCLFDQFLVSLLCHYSPTTSLMKRGLLMVEFRVSSCKVRVSSRKKLRKK